MRRRLTGYTLTAALWLTAGILAPPAGLAADAETAAEPPTYTEDGADQCLKCHDEFSDFPVMDIFKTKHAEAADPATPFARLQCETCHGPGSVHSELGDEDEEKAPLYIRSFRKGAHTPVEEQNRLCISCHEGGHRMDWFGSAHDTSDTACIDCHTVHAAKDAVLHAPTQPDVCFQCHQEKRAEIHRASSHPLRYGQMACSSCHDPHGSLTPSLLRRETLNQTCYECHPEKRGPFLWEHAPVTEDCSICHRPHGSNHPALLERRPPLLCQECHSQNGHPSVAYTADGATLSRFAFGRACLNCHSRIHGSNHPSGIKLER